MGARHDFRVLDFIEAALVAARMGKVAAHNRAAMVAPYAKRHKTSQSEIKARLQRAGSCHQMIGRRSFLAGLLSATVMPKFPVAFGSTETGAYWRTPVVGNGYSYIVFEDIPLETFAELHPGAMLKRLWRDYQQVYPKTEEWQLL